MPKISIIVPIYNSEKYLNQCLESLIHQTMTDIEIICIDGCSKDNSFEILKKVKEKDNRIQIYQKENEGVSLSRNFGLEKAKGDYIMFVDSDDWIDQHTCQKTYETAVNEKADVVMWSYIREFQDSSLKKNIFDNDKIVFEEKEVTRLHRRMIGIVDDELRHVENADALCPVWGKLYATHTIKSRNIKFVDIRKIGTYEDGLFNLNVFENVNKVVYINEYLYHYRKYNADSITSRYKKDLFKQWKHMFEYMRNYIEEHHCDDEYRKALDNRICLSILGQGLNILEGEGNKRKQIKKILNSSEYRAAYQRFDLSYFPIHWKIFYGFAKYNSAIGVYIMLLCIQKMIGR